MYFLRNKNRFILWLIVLVLVLKCIPDISKKIDDDGKTSTICQMLNVALKPVGSTMYIWGGGWSGDDNAAGATSTQIGLSPGWEAFAKEQDESYDFKEHRFEREKGLDCSGYVGWVIYNTFEQENGKNGYVTTSTDLAKSLAERGWGQLIYNSQKFLPGDIVSMEGHVWISLGTCKDGSVLLLHSSPPGVSVCGTPSYGKEKEGKSIAVQLATEYMESHHPDWQEKYPEREVSLSYLENVSVFRWSKVIMKDVKELQGLSAEEVIVYISPDI